MPKKSVEKVAEVKETVKEAEVKETKAAAVKEEVKETAKKAPAKKAPAKKAPAKTTTAKKEVVTETYIQYAGQETLTAELLTKVKAAYVAEGHKESAIKSVKLYVKPEESKVYYVFNETECGSFDI